MEEYSFGYPKYCCNQKCNAIKKCILVVKPYYVSNGSLKVMLIGQDPTIYKKPERVKRVLMLDEENSQLKRWLKGIFGADMFDRITIYATNLVKCSFEQPPSKKVGLFFEQCKEHLFKEIVFYKPDLVLTFGQNTHQLFRRILTNNHNVPHTMKEAFTGEFFKVSIDDVAFDYSPCLHIKTYRVSETYGKKIAEFKNSLEKYLP
ncbi:MAG: uracil-DNA glycosylase family protein [Halanaerobiales bacterium]|nr:uracil-DNA glycosylase family protein [Halanaerobiales bacterium]